MQRFRLRRLWRVNGEALLIASGQNLKRLLQKRGWGRRPFPAQAVALMPPGTREPGRPLRDRFLQRVNVAAASLASWITFQADGRVLASPFSLGGILLIVSSSPPPSTHLGMLFIFLAYCWHLPFRAMNDATTHAFDRTSSYMNIFQQAARTNANGSIVRDHYTFPRTKNKRPCEQCFDAKYQNSYK